MTKNRASAQTAVVSQEQVRTLEEWRAVKKLSKSAIARILDCHPSTYAKLEDNPGNITVETALVLSVVFGCEVKQIKFFKEKPNFKLELSQSS